MSEKGAQTGAILAVRFEETRTTGPLEDVVRLGRKITLKFDAFSGTLDEGVIESSVRLWVVSLLLFEISKNIIVYTAD